MKKSLLLVAFAAALAASASAQIRDYVAVVRPVYDTAQTAFLTATADALKKNGYADLADLTRDVDKNRFGSGFVFVGADGLNFVVTNRHVVSDAVAVNVEFEAADGKKKTYERCQVVAVSDELDLALVAFPGEERPFKAGLSFADALADDGAEVWTAGYPGLGNTPAWQLGKGNITNASLGVPELVDPARSRLIQHSAQVDPGNSGGPLLLAKKDARSGYVVLGVNTWKARFRQAANFSIPAATVRSFLDRATAAPTADNRAARLTERSKDFEAATKVSVDSDTNARIRALTRFVSQALVTAKGSDELLSALASAPSAVRGEMIDTYVESPIEGMRFALAFRMDAILKADAKPAALSSASAPVLDGQAAKASYAFGTETIPLAWREEFAAWRVDALPATSGAAAKTAKEGKKSQAAKDDGVSLFTFDRPYTLLVFGEYNFIPDLGLAGGGMYVATSDFVGLGFGIETGMYSYTDSWGSTGEYRVVFFAPMARVGVPFSFDSFALVPYAEGRFGLALVMGGADLGGFGYELSGGIQGVIPSLGKLTIGTAAGISKPLSETVFFKLWAGFGL